MVVFLRLCPYINTVLTDLFSLDRFEHTSMLLRGLRLLYLAIESPVLRALDFRLLLPHLCQPSGLEKGWLTREDEIQRRSQFKQIVLPRYVNKPGPSHLYAVPHLCFFFKIFSHLLSQLCFPEGRQHARAFRTMAECGKYTFFMC